MTSRGAWAALAALLLIVAARVVVAPVDEFGDDGAAWAEHRARVGWAVALDERAGADEPAPFTQLLRDRATGYPPGLHLAAATTRAVIGDSARAHELMGLGWLLLLAGSVAALSHRLFGVGAFAGFAGTLMLPAFHAAAPRYYYDFPMVAASWAAVAVLAWGMDRRASWVWGAAAGAAAVGACLIKWTALPTALPLSLGVLLARTAARGPIRPLRRLAAGLAFAAVLMGGISAFLSIVGPDNSLVAMLSDSRVAEATDGSLFGAVASSLTSFQPAAMPRALFYLGSLIAVVLSPLGFLAVLVLLPRSRADLEPLRWPAWLLAASYFALLFLLVAPVDERFLLGLLPLVVLRAAVGWQQRSPTGRRHAAVFLFTAGLFVAADVHHGPPAPWNAPLTVRVLPGTVDTPALIPPVTFRGLSLGSSFERRGWARRDDLVSPPAGREALWDWVNDCGAASLLLAPGQPLLSSRGDAAWFEYRAALDALEGRVGPGIQSLECGGPPGAVALTRSAVAPCPGATRLTDGPAPPLVAWSLDGHTRCAAFGGAGDDEARDRLPAADPAPID